MKLKIKIILCLCLLLLLAACSFHAPKPNLVDDGVVPFSISDITSNIPVDAETALANLKIETSGAVERGLTLRERNNPSYSQSFSFYLLPEELELFGYPFEFSYIIQNGKLYLIEFEAIIPDSGKNIFTLMKNIYHYINDELGPPETLASHTIETLIEENKTSETLKESWGGGDYWFFDDTDKEIYFGLQCTYREGVAWIMITCGDTNLTVDDKGRKYMGGPGKVTRKSGPSPKGKIEDIPIDNEH